MARPSESMRRQHNRQPSVKTVRRKNLTAEEQPTAENNELERLELWTDAAAIAAAVEFTSAFKVLEQLSQDYMRAGHPLRFD